LPLIDDVYPGQLNNAYKKETDAVAAAAFALSLSTFQLML